MDRAVSLARYAARSTSGRIVIGFIPGTEGAILAKVLPPLHAQHPETQVFLRDLGTPSQIKALRNR